MPETKKIATLLHTLLCNKSHVTEMNQIDNEDKCCFYVEQSIDICWELKDHKIWMDEARMFLAIAEPHGVQDVLRHLIGVWQTLDGFRKADPRLGSYVVRLINSLKEDL